MIPGHIYIYTVSRHPKGAIALPGAVFVYIHYRNLGLSCLTVNDYPYRLWAREARALNVLPAFTDIQEERYATRRSDKGLLSQKWKRSFRTQAKCHQHCDVNVDKWVDLFVILKDSEKKRGKNKELQHQGFPDGHPL